MGRRSDIRKLQVSRYSTPPPAKPGTHGNSSEPHGKPTKHHLIPGSRGGQTVPSNLMIVPERMHQSWHHVFRNMTPEEAIVYIAAHWTPPGYIKFLKISDGRNDITLTKKDLLRLRDEHPDRMNLPGFADAKRQKWVQPVYRRRRKRGRLR